MVSSARLRRPGAMPRVPVVLLLLAGGLMGLAVFLAVNTAVPLDVTNDGWILDGFIEKDIIQHYTGWLFYRQSPLSFPLGLAQSINYPDGCALTFTDSVPLAAIFFRLFAGLLPATFQYFGWYTLLCYVLQGVAAAALLSLFCDRAVPVLCGTALLCVSPVMIERSLRHTALASHYLILFALTLYFQNKRRGFRFRAGYLVLLGLATAIHPYFLPMVFAVLFADLLEHGLQTGDWLRAGGFLAAGFAAVGAVGFCIGIFSMASTDGAAGGYGYFCMNLNALWNPTSRWTFVWSRLIPVQNQTLGNYDGFNYLGLGVLAALPVCAVGFAARRGCSGCLAFVRRHAGLFFVCVCLTAFAVSTTVTANGATLFSLALPASLASLCDTFRSSGRMFYPVYYLLVLFVIVCLFRFGGKRLGAVLCAAVLFVQLWDISPALAARRAMFTAPAAEYPTPLTADVWADAAQSYDHLFSLDLQLADALYPALYAAQSGMTSNDSWAARYNRTAREEVIAAELAKLRAGEADPDTLYIISDAALFFALADALGDTVWAVGADSEWYLLLPKNGVMTAPQPSESVLVYPDFPLTVYDYTDANWTGGVLNSRPSVCAFLDNGATKRLLDTAEYLVADGTAYEILDKDYRDAGWVMVTLRLEDASVLCGKALTTR